MEPASVERVLREIHRLDGGDGFCVASQEVDPELCCCLCSKPALFGPKILSCCSSIVCGACLMSKSLGECGVCDAEAVVSIQNCQPVSKVVERLVGKVIVKCGSCEEEMMAQSWISHDDEECLMHCPFEGCDKELKGRVALENHKSDCDQKPVRCDGHVVGCKFEALGKENIVQHQQECDYYKLAPVWIEQAERLDELETFLNQLPSLSNGGGGGGGFSF